MGKIILEEKYILEYMKDMLHDAKSGKYVINSKYHHNTDYEDAESICKNGILNIIDLKNNNIKNYSDSLIKLLSDIESHPNGDDGISLAVMGLDDLYAGEEEYNAYCPYKVDFLVSSNIKAGRRTTNYGNEYIHNGSIDKSDLTSVDIRILELIELYEKGIIKSIDDIIKKFNCISDISNAMIISELNIPLREMSLDENTSLDISRLSSNPKVYKKES